MHLNSFCRNLILGFILFLSFGFFSLFAYSFLPVFVLLAYVSYHKFNEAGEIGSISRTTLISLFIASIVAFAAYVFKHYEPRDWDFTCFFIYGNVAVSGLDFYNPKDFHEILKTLQLPITLSDGFMREVIEVGCPYPPPTLLLFSVLGYFSYDDALFIWTCINIIFLISSIFLIRNIFFNTKGYEGIMISTVLVLSFMSTLITIIYSQTLFILLFFLLLFYKFRDKPIAGVFLSVAIFIKPFAGILFFYFIARRLKMTALVFIISSLVISSITALIFGYQPFIEYFLNNPNLREPEWLFTETTNQSLLAELYRNLPDHKSIANLLYITISSIVVATFGTLIFLKKNEIHLHNIFVVIILSVGLIIYPSGQCNYPEVHLISVMILLRYFGRLDTSAFFIFMFYIVSYAGLFYLNLFLLLGSVLLIYKGRSGFIYLEIRNSLKSGT
jgi:hypothetical protein